MSPQRLACPLPSSPPPPPLVGQITQIAAVVIQSRADLDQVPKLSYPNPMHTLYRIKFTVPLSHLRTTLPEIGSRPLPAKQLNLAT